MTRYLVIGAAGHAQEVAWSLRAQIAAGSAAGGELLFFDDRVPPGPLASGLGPVVDTIDAVERHATAASRLVLGIGLPRTKCALVDRLAAVGLPWTTVVHPAALCGPNSHVGEGSYVAAGSILSVNVTIGRFATINFHAQVAHEAVLGDYVTLHPDAHLSGNVSIGDGCELGTGALVIPGITVGPWAVVGAGSVVVSPLEGGVTYAGVPARRLASTAARRIREVRS